MGRLIAVLAVITATLTFGAASTAFAVEGDDSTYGVAASSLTNLTPDSGPIPEGQDAYLYTDDSALSCGSGGLECVDVQWDPGWITATIYFNRGETGLLADYTWYAGLICATVTARFGPVAGIVCMAEGGRLFWYATMARAHGHCLGIRYYYPWAWAYWNIEHWGSRCY